MSVFVSIQQIKKAIVLLCAVGENLTKRLHNFEIFDHCGFVKESFSTRGVECQRSVEEFWASLVKTQEVFS